MELIPIHANGTSEIFPEKAYEHREVIEAFATTYRKAGFYLPWIGYFISSNNEITGCGGFKGGPKENRVEIAYSTFYGYEGRGIGTAVCKYLVTLAISTSPGIIIQARTLPCVSASTRILEKNGFRLTGSVYDEDDGDVWEWEL